jgi:hypothetical protein
MKMGNGKNNILDALMEEPMSIEDLKNRTGLSDSYVRNSVRHMELQGSVEKVDKRVPYMYRIPLDNPLMRHRELVKDYKKTLLTGEDLDDISKFVRNYPKNIWIDIVPNLEAVAIAITRLNEEGLLLETLEA